MDHPNRSQQYIINNPKDYFLDDFPVMGKKPYSRVAEAVGIVCLGHSEEKFVSFNDITYKFYDACLSEEPLNLKKLSALLRIADEADDPYIRLIGSDQSSIRSHIPLVSIKENIIVWHWDKSDNINPEKLNKLREKKIDALRTAKDYIEEIGGGKWFFVLDPEYSIFSNEYSEFDENPHNKFIKKVRKYVEIEDHIPEGLKKDANKIFKELFVKYLEQE